MCIQLGVSRTTLREAFRILDNDHLIERRRGLGTFVLSSPILKELGSNFGITEMIVELERCPRLKPLRSPVGKGYQRSGSCP